MEALKSFKIKAAESFFADSKDALTLQMFIEMSYVFRYFP